MAALLHSRDLLGFSLGLLWTKTEMKVGVFIFLYGVRQSKNSDPAQTNFPQPVARLSDEANLISRF
jgi:hypothetical protein